MKEPINIDDVYPLPEGEGAALAAARAEFGDADRSQWVIEKQHFEEGRTLSADAVIRTLNHVGRFLSARLDAIWDETGKPPQSLVINVHIPGPLETRDDLLRARARMLAALADVDIRLANADS